MSQIEVPSWVVEAAAKAYFEDMCSIDRWNDPMDEKEREDWRDGARKIITAALGAWVVEAPALHISERCETCGDVLHASVSATSHFTLRQEKPE